jgi:hypothetical protein
MILTTAKAKENCKGCGSLSINSAECFFTKVGIPAFSDCPCQICLIKSLCHALCDDFYKMIDRERNITNYSLNSYGIITGTELSVK